MARTCVLIALLNPEDAFQDTIEILATDFGMLQITQNKLKLVRTPVDEDAPQWEIYTAGFVFLKAFLSTLAWVTGIGVGYEPFDYLDIGEGPFRWTTPLSDRASQIKVDSSALSSTQELLPLVMGDSHLQWALEDFRTALREPGHQLIFLYRSIEWLSRRFGGWSKLREEIGITNKQLNAIKKPANEQYLARHVPRTGPRPVPPQVLDDALKNTKIILQKYVEWLRSQPINRT